MSSQDIIHPLFLTLKLKNKKFILSQTLCENCLLFSECYGRSYGLNNGFRQGPDFARMDPRTALGCFVFGQR